MRPIVRGPGGPSSVLDLFSIGIGPSSSHTVGPMRAALRFLAVLRDKDLLHKTSRVGAELYGSLALTGRGHGTDRALVLGLEGVPPEQADPMAAEARLSRARETGKIMLDSGQETAFNPDCDLVCHLDEVLPGHPNGMRLISFDAENRILFSREYYSVGGGAVACPDEDGGPGESRNHDRPELPHPYASAAEMIGLCRDKGLPLDVMVMGNEAALHPRAEVRDRLLEIWEVMRTCAEKGIKAEGILPGGLNVPRRACELYRRYASRPEPGPFAPMDWLNAHALAVSEENAAGGRVVTAPTNGAAGVVPAALHFYHRFAPGADQDGVLRFLLVAGAVGALYKDLASISGAEVGCQGEVGVACSMAAAGLVSAMGGTNDQIEHAAEMAMEHNLGLTCDPVAGLVQIPCIERNAMAAVKAVNAARLALCEKGQHKVMLDQVIATMLQTGLDMASTYKETATGGLAVNFSIC